ncbi:uncharacterized protein BJ212DRAFT_1305699 [Suillus subaureus]|uniref:Uncharacterized protein n=1 Tax=Suillus subaureus TaxID=48587 RepID=A0A9P7DMT8_9AGAM|nr:uncharacterized protein BJ212DRAFT_1305699 [Suillus subaureus]KAG1798718.1 hypothetical protein BJ212DRAFT_1305699 [Suillus subaureus]
MALSAFSVLAKKTTSYFHHTDTLVQHLSTNSADACILFYEGKKTAASNNNECPSGKDKGEIHRFLAKLIFKDSDYLAAYAEDPKKFDVTVGNHIISLEKSFKEQLNKFNKTGAGVTPLDENAAANLHKQVLLKFPCWESTMPGTSIHLFIHLPPPNPQLPPSNPQLPLQDSWLPLPNQLDTGAQHSPPAYLPPSHHPPSHFTSARGSPVEDSYADDNSPLSALLGNTLDVLDGDINMYDDDNDDDGVEYNSSQHHVISSPPKVVEHKQQYTASPSPPPVKTNAFILPWKPQTLAYHSYVAFGSASPGSQAPCRPPSFTSSLGISHSRSTPSSTASSSYLLTDYRILPMASQTLLSAKPQNLASSKKKRTWATDVKGHLSMLNNKIQSMQSDMSEHQGSRNECYAIKMNY